MFVQSKYMEWFSVQMSGMATVVYDRYLMRSRGGLKERRRRVYEYRKLLPS